MTRIMTRGVTRAVVMATMAALLAVAGCGKKGSPSPPGPASEIIYPKSYPPP